MWLTIIVAAAILGTFMGPVFARIFSPGTMFFLLMLIIGGVIAFVIWALSNNKGGVKADTRTLAEARTMRAPEGKARIYVTRRGFVAALQGMNVTLDGAAKGQIKSGQMLMADVAPGTHHLHVSTAMAKLAKGAELDIAVAAGEIAVIDAMMEMGALKGSVKLTRVDAATKGRADVQATKLILWEVPPTTF